MLEAILAVMVLACGLLIGGAVALWRRGVRKQAVLMVVLAGVAALNVAIWTVPDDSGDAPLERIEGGEGLD
ncbi:hypothetical protein GRI38_01860 [Altererythrobacter aurantiacus]|uniref:Uncharacterized protein n=1 Tax=Parapontixanthobacter aurantiacus TaxID=1463599 RepID=A0A844ZGD2_9SPHN|nr:hypothetical protein [Parapontixanthobacter aurantiacus]MXO84779.1 hypothetical protein [Parapontixanthobacter aurantiacus]